jgi:hypothetical protein
MTTEINNVAATMTNLEATTTESNTVEVVNQTDVAVINDQIENTAEVNLDDWTIEKFKGKSKVEVEESYKNLEAALGKRVQDMPEDVIKQFLKVPSVPEQYALPDEAKEVLSDEILQIAHKNNLSQDQMKEIADALVLNHRSKKEMGEKEANAFIEANKKELEQEFGIALDKRMDAVKSILSQYGTEELSQDLKESGLLHNAKFIKFLDSITQDALSVKLVGADYKAGSAVTPSEAISKIEAKKADPEFMAAYQNRRHPEHLEAIEEMSKLFRAMSPTVKG